MVFSTKLCKVMHQLALLLRYFVTLFSGVSFSAGLLSVMNARAFDFQSAFACAHSLPDPHALAKKASPRYDLLTWGADATTRGSEGVRKAPD